MSTPAPDPSVPCRAYLAQRDRWQTCQDLRDGADVVRAAGARYLPVAPMERPTEYAERVSQAEFFNGFERTVRGLVGLVFRKPPTWGEGTDATLLADAESIDGAGHALDVFAAALFDEALAKGHTFLFVDAPPVEAPERLSAADRQALRLRPYWIHVKPEQVKSWRTELVGGITVLTQAVIEECTLEAVGAFGETEVTRYRVLQHDLATGVIAWAVWGRAGAEAAWQEEDRGIYRGIDRIPLVPIVAGPELGTFHTKPPLLDLAFTNIAHYQVGADHRYSMHRAAIPVPYFIGRDTSKDLQTVGLNVGIDIASGGSVGYLEHNGAGLSHIRQHLLDLKQDMATQGLAMLQRESRAAETAEARRIDKSEQDSALARAARNLEDALETALALHAQFRGVEAPALTLNVDYEALSLDPATITAYAALVDGSAGQPKLSLETFWQILKEGGALPKGFDPDLELARIGEGALRTIGGAAASDGLPESPAP